jgi:hypothetical protein
VVSAGGLDTVTKLGGVLAWRELADYPGPRCKEMIPINRKLFLPAKGVYGLAGEDWIMQDTDLYELGVNVYPDAVGIEDGLPLGRGLGRLEGGVQQCRRERIVCLGGECCG